MINSKIEQEIKALINQFNAKNFEHVILKSKTLITSFNYYRFQCIFIKLNN